MREVRVEDTLVVDAPAAMVWAAIKDPALQAEWHPFVTGISGEHALGALRHCSVLVGKKRGETTERCVEEEPEQRIVWTIEQDSTGFSRMVSDWRAGFSLLPVEGRTRVTAESVFRPRSTLLRLARPIVLRKFHRAQRAILEALAQAVEQGVGGRGVGALEETGGG